MGVDLVRKDQNIFGRRFICDSECDQWIRDEKSLSFCCVQEIVFAYLGAKWTQMYCFLDFGSVRINSIRWDISGFGQTLKIIMRVFY